MRLSKKILLVWGCLVAVYVGTLQFFPHQVISFNLFLNRIIQALLLIISIFIFLKEPNRKNKFIFLNFVLFFFVLVLASVQEFVQMAIFTGEGNRYAGFLFGQYAIISYLFFLSVAIVYIVIDLMFRDFKTVSKYFLTLSIVLAFLGAFFLPYLKTPLFAYDQEEVKQYKTLFDALEKQLPAGADLEPGNIPSAVELANQVTLQSWQEGKPIGDLYPEQNIRVIESLIPYLPGANYAVLVLKPLLMKSIYMEVFIIGFIILFFGYQYKKDPPQGAYIDKIMFLFLLYCSMEILHNWGFKQSVEWKAFDEMFKIGQYVTALIEVMIMVFFSLRLRFITSVQGEFYETELATNPHQVSRWRDWLDELVLSQFFSFKLFNGRLFQDPSERERVVTK